MSNFTFYTFTIAYVLLLTGAYQAFRYNSPKRSVIIMSIAVILEVFCVFCNATGFLTSPLTTGLGNNFYKTLGLILGNLYFLIFILSFIPYKRGNIQLHQRMILGIIIIDFLAAVFIDRGTIELLAPFRPIIP